MQSWMKIIEALVTGLTQGAMIALVALGYTMVYGVLKLINFAHSEVFMMGAYFGDRAPQRTVIGVGTTDDVANLVAFSAYLGDLVGQVFAMFVLTVAAGEAAIGLAILVIYFRGRGTIAVDDINRMKG